jgi:hypothetical protein
MLLRVRINDIVKLESRNCCNVSSYRPVGMTLHRRHQHGQVIFWVRTDEQGAVASEVKQCLNGPFGASVTVVDLSGYLTIFERMQ